MAEEFEEQIQCLWENTKKHITFSVPIQKENGNGEQVTNKIKLINSVRFKANTLSSLTNNLAEGIEMCKLQQKLWKRI